MIRLDCLDVVQAMHAAGLAGVASDPDREMAAEMNAMKAALRMSTDRCDSCANNPSICRKAACDAADYMCVLCKERKLCVCVGCYPGEGLQNKWRWKGRDDGQGA